MRKYTHMLKFPLIVKLCLVLTLFTAHSSASSIFGDNLNIDPWAQWNTLTTPHFRITFEPKNEKLAKKAAEYFEIAHLRLKDRLIWEPQHRTQILALDRTDYANGLTSAVGRFGIAIYLTPPESSYSTANTDDWLWMLVNHEYTHFLNMDATRDFYVPLRILFGDLLLPNSLWPHWMLEGAAVYYETLLSTSGRGRSTDYDRTLRTAVNAQLLNAPEWVTLDRVNGGVTPYAPGGELPYLFGYELMNEAELTRAGAIGELSKRSSWRFPFFINGNAENVTGSEWYTHWDHFIEKSKAHATEQNQKIKEAGISETVALPELAHLSVAGAVFSNDGTWLAANAWSADETHALWLLNRRTHVLKKIYDHAVNSGMSFTPDSKWLIFSSVHHTKEYYDTNDLAAFNLAIEESTRFAEPLWLTENARARDPDTALSPLTGLMITYTQNDEGRTGVVQAQLEVDGNTLRLTHAKRVYWPEMLIRASMPKFTKNADKIVFSVQEPRYSAEEIVELSKLDTTTPYVQPLCRRDRAPLTRERQRFATLWQDQVVFTSDAEGLDILSECNKTVARVPSGLWFATYSPEGDLYASQYTLSQPLSESGWRFSKVQKLPQTAASDRLRQDPLSHMPVAQSEKQPPLPPMLQSTDPQSPDVISAQQVKAQPYSIFPSIYPRQWAPYLYFTENQQQVGAQLLGFDALDLHEYLALATYDGFTRRPAGELIYKNRTLGSMLTFTTVYDTPSRSDSIFFQRLKSSVNIEHSFKTDDQEISLSLQAQGEQNTLYKNNERKDRSKPTWVLDSFLYTNNLKNAALAFAPESGSTLVFGIRIRPASHFATETGTQFTSQINQFFRIGPAKRHFSLDLKLGASGATTSRSNSWVLLRSPTSGDSLLDSVPLKGYGTWEYAVPYEAHAGAQIAFPIAQIYRGWETYPFFLENLGLYFYADVTRMSSVTWLPSFGAGIQLNSLVFVNMPLVTQLEVRQGTNRAWGGETSAVFSVGMNSQLF